MKNVSDLAAELDKIIGGNAVAQAVTRFIDSGYPPLNEIMSGRIDGGLPFGRMMEVFGESSSGKTALATQWMVRAQQMGGIAIFIDWERSFDVEMAKEMGLNDERPFWIYARPRTWEEGNLLASKACRLIRGSKVIPDDAPILVVFDSLASALPKSSVDKEIDELTMNDTSALARVTSTTLKVQAQIAADHDATFVYLNQVREAIGVIYGDKTKTPGGKAMEFYSTIRLSLTRQKLMEARDGDKTFVGQNINIKCTKSKLTAPFKTCSIRLSFDDDTGMARFDFATSLIDYAVDRGIITSSGPRVTWTDGKQYFKKALAEKINSEDLLDELKGLIRKSEKAA